MPDHDRPSVARVRPHSQPQHLAWGRWLGDFDDLTPAETRLVDRCALGKPWQPEGWIPAHPARPVAGTAANTVRASLIRFLALGGDAAHPVHEAGVIVRGAWIAGQLDLHQCQAAARLDLKHCHFAQSPIFRSANLPELSLSGSMLPGFRAERLIVRGSLFLRDGFRSNGEIRLFGAKIGGSLDCAKAELRNPHGKCLLGDRIEISGGCYLRDGFSAHGEVCLRGSQIGGTLDCDRGSFRTSAEGLALNCERATVKGNLFMRGVEMIGAVSLETASIGTLSDDANVWKHPGHSFDGFDYKRIIGPTDAPMRVAWLMAQHEQHLSKRDWRPQPWEQLIKILRDMGHGFEAGEIAIAKQNHMRKAGIIGGPLRRAFHWLYGLLAGYGHRPARTVGAMIAVWLIAAVYFHFGAEAGYMGPGTPLLNQAALAGDVAKQCGHRFESDKTIWTRCPAMPPEYTTFQPLLYSLDLILPLVDLQQERDWAPIVEDPPGRNLVYGVFLRWVMWFEILFGWAMSLMLAAVLGRLVEKD